MKTRVFMEKYLVHDPKEQCVIGDLVQIKECELMSPKKFFTLEDIIQKARRYTCPKTGQLYTTP